MFKKFKKAFTLVELVVVIAVIAILTAVSVASYVHLTDDAKKSNDLSKAASMNSVVQIRLASSQIDSVSDLMYILLDAGIDPTTTSQEDVKFMYDPSLNKILLVDRNNNVLNYDGYSNDEYSNWWSLDYSEQSISNNVSSYEDLFN